MTAFPLNDTEYLADDLRMFHAGRTAGLINSTGEEFEVKAAGGMNLTVSDGVAYLKTSNDGIGGIVFSPKDEVKLTANVAASYTRYDYVAIRYTKATNTCELVYQEGTQTKPAPTRNLEQYELIIAIVALKGNTGEITQDMIQDTRLDEGYCGLTVDTLTKIPTQELYNQFEAFYQKISLENSEYQYQEHEKFRKWFEALDADLQEEVATALAARILKLEDMVLSNHIYTDLMADATNALTDEEGTNLLADWQYQVK